jgi:hypothetical protein
MCRKLGEKQGTTSHFTQAPFLFSAVAEANGLSAVRWAVLMQISLPYIKSK